MSLSKLDIKGAKNKYRTPVDCRTIEQKAFDESQLKTITNYYRQKQTEHLEHIKEPPSGGLIPKGYIPYD
jgi:hypothetical protein